MIPGTGNDTLDVVLEIGIALALVVTLVLPLAVVWLTGARRAVSGPGSS